MFAHGGCSAMAARQLVKLEMGVQFPSPTHMKEIIMPNWVRDPRTPNSLVWQVLRPGIPMPEWAQKVEYADWLWNKLISQNEGSDIKISTFQPKYIAQVADLYDRAFVGFPWFEPPLGQEEVIKYIKKEFSKTFAIALLALDGDLPVGFAWGYQLTPQEFANSKYEKSDSESKNLIVQTLPALNFFYISEVGIDPSYQGRGLGTVLTIQLANILSPILLRTIEDSPMRKIDENQLGMIAIIAPWLTAKDPENEKRVIYTKLP